MGKSVLSVKVWADAQNLITDVLFEAAGMLRISKVRFWQSCFCDLHDTEAFKVIEAGAPDFDANNDEMKFVYEKVLEFLGTVSSEDM